MYKKGGGDMIKVKRFTGVFYRENKDKSKVYYIKGKLHGKQYLKKVGSSNEGVNAQYANQMRMKLHADPTATLLAKDAPTLGEAAEEYFNRLGHKSDTTTMKNRLNQHAANLLHMRLTKIKNKDIEDLKSTMINTVSERTERTLSKATVNRVVDIISAIVNSYNKYNETNYANPCKNVDRFKTDNRRERYLNHEEIELLYKTIQDSSKLRKKQQVTLLVRLALTTGARLSSVLNIKYRDIKDNRITIKDFKSNTTYTGYLHPTVKEMLPSDPKPENYVVGDGATAVGRTSVNKMLQPVLNDLFNVGLDVEDSKNRVVIHSLRHTFASLLAIKGVPILTIKKLLNHSNIDQTLRYAKLAPDQGMDAVNDLF